MDGWDTWSPAGVKQDVGDSSLPGRELIEPITKFSTGVASFLMTKDAWAPQHLVVYYLVVY
jgi:hypothetical protein